MNTLKSLSIALLFPVLICAIGGCGNDASSADKSKSTPNNPSSPDNNSTNAADSQIADSKTANNSNQQSAQAGAADKIIELFDGESLNGWEITNYGTERECYVKNGYLVIDAGIPVSGVNSTREDLPKTNYEISFSAKRIEGIDFFCGLTFPVADSHCSLIVGGWAGAVVGLSNIDDEDASSNETRTVMSFEDDRWYKIRVRVLPKNISAWIDEEQIIDLNTEGRKIDVRNDVLISRPLGLMTFETKAAYKDIQLKKLK